MFTILLNPLYTNELYTAHRFSKRSGLQALRTETHVPGVDPRIRNRKDQKQKK